MNQESRIAYAEVDAILNLLEIEAVEKVPLKIREFLKYEKDKNYIPEINEDLSGLNKETIALLTLLEINYWCETDEEKQSILNELKKNDIIKENELREKYNPDNIFKNKNNKQEKEIVAMVEYKEQSFLRKLLKKIKGMFRRK